MCSVTNRLIFLATIFGHDRTALCAYVHVFVYFQVKCLSSFRLQRHLCFHVRSEMPEILYRWLLFQEPRYMVSVLQLAFWWREPCWCVQTNSYHPILFYFSRGNTKVHKPSCHSFNSVDITLLMHLSLAAKAVANQTQRSCFAFSPRGSSRLLSLTHLQN